MKTVLIFSLFLALASCDFSTHEYILYVAHQNSQDEVRLGWGIDSSCYISVSDTTLDFDNVEIVFPSDNSILNSERISYYTREYIDQVLQEDSTLHWSYQLDFEENDARVLANDSIFARIRLGNRLLKKITLYKKKTESRFIDRLGIPKTC
ncbi:MAG: hypothetical protein HRT58_08240 [Crocinitomicaceae bacterium]|nr:hypothetical protein [Flavobacteriales bacterium]NQZ35638.1 hypothetical protein [Crocinitomicaceae bacterium]